MNETDLSPTNRLFAAIADGSLSGVEKACEDGANVNAVNAMTDTPLYIACRKGFAHIVEQLLEHPDIDITKGGYDHYRQTPAGCVCAPSGEPEYHMTPLCAAVQGGYCRIVEMLLEHEDGDKYLRPNDEWETTIARAFDLWHISPALVILIEAAMTSDRKFLLFTLQKVIEYGVDGFRGDPERLATLLKQFPSEVRALAVGSFVTMLIKIVNDNDEYGHLYNLLRIAPYFCSSERLRPYLLSALHLARQRHYFDCEDSLRDTLDGTVVVH